ncbi:MAG: carboxypeptidase-like regulatory domain-containing protein [Desulfobulbaceae bacterium]|nr:carboxypeptidase-like regulatory domain-containing protein [Desulfobulbaceae bacterium]
MTRAVSLSQYFTRLTLLIITLSFTPMAHATTIEGIVLTDEGPVADASVQAYRTFSDLQQQTNTLVSDASTHPGQYTIELAPGKYYMTARGKNQSQALFSYHGLNPITITDTYQWIPFFVLPERPAQCEAGYQGIGGRVLYKDIPLNHGSVTIYTTEDEPFRGMGVLTNSITEDGRFWFDLPPGNYVVIARQRHDDAAIGPLKKGDLFCYASANPIRVTPANSCQVDLLCYPRNDLDHYLDKNALDPRGKHLANRQDSSLQKTSMQDAGRKGGTADGPISIIAGRVTDLNNIPMPGMVVSAYPADDLPLFQMYVLRFKSNFLAKTDAKGFFRLEVDPGSYYMVAREKVGDAPNAGEHYGIYEGTANHSLTVGRGESKTGIQLVVEPIMP